MEISGNFVLHSVQIKTRGSTSLNGKNGRIPAAFGISLKTNVTMYSLCVVSTALW